MKYIICNWKNYLSLPDGSKLLEIAHAFQKSREDLRIIILPDDFHIGYFVATGEIKTDIAMGVQSVSPENQFPHTGDVAFEQIPANIEYVLVGHAERRRFEAYETPVLQEKIRNIEKYNKKLIYCIGEQTKTLDFAAIKDELQSQLEALSECNQEVLICYEPTWAIGGDRTPGPEILEEMLRWVYEHTCEVVGHEQVHVLYGGGVSPDSIDTILSAPGCEGVIIGSRCTKPDVLVELFTNIS